MCVYVPHCIAWNVACCTLSPAWAIQVECPISVAGTVISPLHGLECSLLYIRHTIAGYTGGVPHFSGRYCVSQLHGLDVACFKIHIALTAPVELLLTSQKQVVQARLQALLATNLPLACIQPSQHATQLHTMTLAPLISLAGNWPGSALCGPQWLVTACSMVAFWPKAHAA